MWLVVLLFYVTGDVGPLLMTRVLVSEAPWEEYLSLFLRFFLAAYPCNRVCRLDCVFLLTADSLFRSGFHSGMGGQRNSLRPQFSPSVAHACAVVHVAQAPSKYMILDTQGSWRVTLFIQAGSSRCLWCSCHIQMRVFCPCEARACCKRRTPCVHTH